MAETARSIGSVAAEVVNQLAERMGREKPFGVEQHPVTDRSEWLRWRRQDITASGAAALLGAHPFVTAYGLWAEKTGAVPADAEMTEAMERGIELEPIAVKRLAKLQPTWKVEQPNTYYRDPAARLGCTPDAFASDPARDGFGVIQVKSVEPSVFRKKWRSEEGVEPPLWIVCQAIIEAHLTGASWAAVAALVISYGIELHVVEVPLHAGIIERIKSETAAFWQMVESGQRPEPDWMRDGRLVEALYAPVEGTVIDLSDINYLPEIADEKERLSAQNRVNELRMKEIKAEFLARLGDASAARIADGRLITAKRVERKAYSVKASSYVQVQVKKEAAL